MSTEPIIMEQEVYTVPPTKVSHDTPYQKTVTPFREKQKELNRRFLNHEDMEDGPGLSDILDDYFQNSFGGSESGMNMDLINNPYAIIATGSYGRREVSRRPDVSILFIFKDTIPKGAVGLIRDIVYPLWDLGFSINHSTKTVKDCLTTATKDFGTLLSLISSRFICGVSPLYSRLMSQIREKIVFSRKKDILSFLYNRDCERHEKFQGPDDLLEPDLVFSEGGLKDYHSIMSAARISLGMMEPRAIEYEGFLSADEYQALNESVAFLRRVITFIQLSSSHLQSRLPVNLQHKAARFMNYGNDKGQNAVDLFLGDVSRHMERIRIIKHLFFLSLSPDIVFPNQTSDTDVKTKTKWVSLAKGLVSVTSSVKLIKHPKLLPGVFHESLVNGAPLSPETRRLVHEFRYLIDDTYLEDPETIRQFEALVFLSPSGSGIPETMLETGLLSAFLPVFDKLHHRREFGVHPSRTYHSHHLLTLYHLKALLENHGSKIPVLPDETRLALLWAGFLHDIGKVTTLKHHEKASVTELKKILPRFHKNESFIRSVCFLVEHHHRMERIVATENLTEGTAIKPFLDSLENPEQLTLLYYLSLADMRARGGGTVNDFIEADLSLFYDACMTISAGPSHASSPAPFANTPDSLDKIKALDDRKKDAPCLHVLDHQNTRTVTLAFPMGLDALPGVLSAFLVHNMDVYDLRVIMEEDKPKYLVLRVTTPKDRMFEKQRWSEFEKKLGDFFKKKASPDPGLMDLGHDKDELQFTHPKVKIYHPQGSLFTRIDIQSMEQSLLLYRITRILTQRSLRVLFLRKGYHKNGSQFLFWVQTKDGHALSSDEKLSLKAVLDDECNGP